MITNGKEYDMMKSKRKKIIEEDAFTCAILDIHGSLFTFCLPDSSISVGLEKVDDGEQDEDDQEDERMIM